jgi:hypothetical protein
MPRLFANPELVELRRDIAAKEYVVAGLKELQLKHQAITHAPHPSKILHDAIAAFELELTGDQARLRRIELVGR